MKSERVRLVLSLSVLIKKDTEMFSTLKRILPGTAS